MSIIRWLLEFRLRRIKKRFLEVASYFLAVSRLSAAGALRRYWQHVSNLASAADSMRQLGRYSQLVLRHKDVDECVGRVERLRKCHLKIMRYQLAKLTCHLSPHAQNRLREMILQQLVDTGTADLSQEMERFLLGFDWANWDAILSPSALQIGPDEVLGLYDQICLEKPDVRKLKLADVWCNTGSGLFNEQHYAEAVSCFAKALELDPRSSEAWFMSGICLDMVDQLDAAILHFEEALKLDPAESLAWYWKGLAEGKLGRCESGAHSLRQFLRLHPVRNAELLRIADERLRELEAKTT